MKLQRYIKNGVPRGVHNGAAVVMNPKTGEVLAMVGSVDFGIQQTQG